MTACTVEHLIASARHMEAMPLVEVPDGSNHVPYVTVHYGLDRQPWCAMGVSRAFEDAGFVEAINFSTAKGFAYCPTGIAAFRRRGQWHPGIAGIRAGDVVFFDWEHDGEADHVGIVTGPYAGGRFPDWECNRDNRCEYGVRSASSVVGYGRPAYATAPPPPPARPPAQWKELDMAKLESKYVQVTTDARGFGQVDLKTKGVPVGAVPNSPDPAKDHWPSISATVGNGPDGSRHVVLTGAPPNGKIGVWVTVAEA